MSSMPSSNPVEHFVTLFDSNFLPMGMCLHASLMEHGQPFHLWILCMDERVEAQLRQLDLPCISLIQLREVESTALLEVKKTRTIGEYCWTLTPFTPQFVLDRDKNVERVTYLDADLFFFDAPRILLQEFEKSGKHVLITEHAYSPGYDQSSTSGRFCVQFMTFRRTDGGYKVMRWWQERCIEWCFNRVEDGKFGDQKYLDDWEERFFDEVHVLNQVEKALAPWNASRFCSGSDSPTVPVFYHFHSLRIISPGRVILFRGYKMRGLCTTLYVKYLSSLRNAVRLMWKLKMEVPTLPYEKGAGYLLRTLKLCMLGRMDSASL